MDVVRDIVVALGKFCVVMMMILGAWWDHKEAKRTGNHSKRSLYGGFSGFGGGCGGAGGGCSGGGGGC
jgi:hypothetical protein